MHLPNGDLAGLGALSSLSAASSHSGLAPPGATQLHLPNHMSGVSVVNSTQPLSGVHYSRPSNIDVSSQLILPG